MCDVEQLKSHAGVNVPIVAIFKSAIYPCTWDAMPLREIAVRQARIVVPTKGEFGVGNRRIGWSQCDWIQRIASNINVHMARASAHARVWSTRWLIRSNNSVRETLGWKVPSVLKIQNYTNPILFGLQLGNGAVLSSEHYISSLRINELLAVLHIGAVRQDQCTYPDESQYASADSSHWRSPIGHIVIVLAFAFAMLGSWSWYYCAGWIRWWGFFICSVSPLIGLLGAIITWPMPS
jgi:hypothetical protein